jgi:hypothetical protein
MVIRKYFTCTAPPQHRMSSELGSARKLYSSMVEAYNKVTWREDVLYSTNVLNIFFLAIVLEDLGE